MPRTFQLPKFVDLYPNYTASGYTATNEEVAVYKHLLRGVKVNRAAGIISGGEIFFGCLLPIANELVGIDHSYRSIYVAMMKLLLLQSHTPTRLFQLLLKENYTELVDKIVKLHAYLPPDFPAKEALVTKFSMSEYRKACLHNRLPRIPKEALERVTLMHGDMTDLEPLPKFDLIYVSNAMEHAGRNYKTLPLRQVLNLVNPGGLILLTSSFYCSSPKHEGATLLEEVKGFESTWRYILLKKD